MVASGFPALGYQIVWTQQSALWLGHESAAVLAVVAAFFGGLALGALTLGPRVDRSARPGRWYAGCEAIIGLWSLVLAYAMPSISSALLELIGPTPSPVWHWFVAFGGTLLLLLPATLAMGATLPAMERVVASLRRRTDAVAAIYACNTLGAVLGVLGTAFWLIPMFGLTRTVCICAALNFLCAAMAVWMFSEPLPAYPSTTKPDPSNVLGALAVTGFLGIGYEVLVVRVLSQVAENTVYTFALLLAIYLVGTTLGAAAYGRWMSVTADRIVQRDRLLRWLSLTCLAGLLFLAVAGTFKGAIVRLLGPSMSAALTAEASLAIAAFLLPTFAMGALWSHLAKDARSSGLGLARAIGINTFAAALAPLLFGVMLVPALGPKACVILVAAGYLALSSRHAWSTLQTRGVAAAMLLLAFLAPSLATVDVPPDGRIVSVREGVLATVSVIESADGVLSLHINNRHQEGSSATIYADARQALLPITLHAAPRRALFLGLGTGVTASAATADPRLDVEAVELLPEVIDASSSFTQMVDPERRHRLHVTAADARRFVRTSSVRYDLIVSDNFHPARSGSGSLYTVEHFAAVRERLADHGVFCQWLPLHQLDLESLKSIVRSFLAVYPNAWTMLATYSLDTPVVGLVARRDGLRFDPAEIRSRLAALAVQSGPAQYGIVDELALLGSFIAGPEALARFSGDAPYNTDDRPVVAYRAPRITYAPDSSPRDRLIALLHQLEIRPEELIGAVHDDALESRLSAYWAARNRFVEAGRDVRLTNDPSQMLAQVRESLLSVLRVSPDFRPAYDPLLRMALSLAPSDAATARRVLIDLQQLQPERPEASEALREIASVPR